MRDQERGKEHPQGDALPREDSSSNSLKRRAARPRPKSAPKGKLSQRPEADSPERAPFTDTVTPVPSISSSPRSSSPSSPSVEVERPALKRKKKQKSVPSVVKERGQDRPGEVDMPTLHDENVENKETEDVGSKGHGQVEVESNTKTDRKETEEQRPSKSDRKSKDVSVIKTKKHPQAAREAVIDDRDKPVMGDSRDPPDSQLMEEKALDEQLSGLEEKALDGNLSEPVEPVKDVEEPEEKPKLSEDEHKTKDKVTPSSSVLAEAGNMPPPKATPTDKKHKHPEKPDKQSPNSKEEADTADEVSEIESEVVSPRRLDGTSLLLDLAEQVAGPDYGSTPRMVLSPKTSARSLPPVGRELKGSVEEYGKEELPSRGQDDVPVLNQVNHNNSFSIESRGGEEGGGGVAGGKGGMYVVTLPQYDDNENVKRKGIWDEKRNNPSQATKTSKTPAPHHHKKQADSKSSSSSTSSSSSSSASTSDDATYASSSTSGGSHSEAYSTVARKDERACLNEEQDGEVKGYTLNGKRKENIIKTSKKKEGQQSRNGFKQEEKVKIPRSVIPPPDLDASRGEEETDAAALENHVQARIQPPVSNSYTVETVEKSVAERGKEEKEQEQTHVDENPTTENRHERDERIIDDVTTPAKAERKEEIRLALLNREHLDLSDKDDFVDARADAEPSLLPEDRVEVTARDGPDSVEEKQPTVPKKDGLDLFERGDASDTKKEGEHKLSLDLYQKDILTTKEEADPKPHQQDKERPDLTDTDNTYDHLEKRDEEPGHVEAMSNEVDSPKVGPQQASSSSDSGDTSASDYTDSESDTLDAKEATAGDVSDTSLKENEVKVNAVAGEGKDGEETSENLTSHSVEEQNVAIMVEITPRPASSAGFSEQDLRADSNTDMTRDSHIDIVFSGPDSAPADISAEEDCPLPTGGVSHVPESSTDISISGVRRLSVELGTDVESVVMAKLRRLSADSVNGPQQGKLSESADSRPSSAQRKLSSERESGDEIMEPLKLERRRSSLSVPLEAESLQLTDRWVTEKDLSKVAHDNGGDGQGGSLLDPLEDVFTNTSVERADNKKTSQDIEINTPEREEDAEMNNGDAKDRDTVVDNTTADKFAQNNTGVTAELETDREIEHNTTVEAQEGEKPETENPSRREYMTENTGDHRLDSESPVEDEGGKDIPTESHSKHAITIQEKANFGVTPDPETNPSSLTSSPRDKTDINGSSSSLSSSTSSSSKSSSADAHRHMTKYNQPDERCGGTPPYEVSSPIPATPEEMLRKQEALRAGQSTPLPRGHSIEDEELEAFKQEVERDVSRPQDPVNVTLPPLGERDHMDLYVIHESENETSDVEKSGGSQPTKKDTGQPVVSAVQLLVDQEAERTEEGTSDDTTVPIASVVVTPPPAIVITAETDSSRENSG